MQKRLLLLVPLVSLFLLVSCVEDNISTSVVIQDFSDAEYATLTEKLDIPRVIEPISVDLPRHMTRNRVSNQSINAKLALLGRVLFYDTQLSITGEKSCASCHLQSAAFSDVNAFSEGINGQLTKRNSQALAATPSFESSYGSADNFSNFVGFFWDERANSITQQSAETIENTIEMGHDLENLAAQLRNQEMYRILSTKAFRTPDLTSNRILTALEAFTNSIVSGSSRFDRLTDQQFFGASVNSEPVWTLVEERGRLLYNQHCANCHSFDMSFPAKAFANNGLDLVSDDKGKGEVSNRPEDMAVFKVPFLRNIELTAPYMHDGRFETLEEVIDHYSENIQPHVNLDFELEDDLGQPKQMNFSEEDKAAIIAFLRTTTDDRLPFEERLSDPFK